MLSTQRPGCTLGCAPVPNPRRNPPPHPLFLLVPFSPAWTQISRPPSGSLPSGLPGHPCAHRKASRVYLCPQFPEQVSSGPEAAELYVFLSLSRRDTSHPALGIGRALTRLGGCRTSRPTHLAWSKRCGQTSTWVSHVPKRQKTSDPQLPPSGTRVEWGAGRPDDSDGCHRSWGAAGPGSLRSRP